MINPFKFLLPGLFLLLLGIGNISVGVYKGQQYEQVLEELKQRNPRLELVNASPMRRIHFARNTANRLYQRQNKAKQRLDFYRLVALGGTIFLALGIPLLVVGLLLRLRRMPKEQMRAA